jgi:hypothetical protein
MIKINLLVFGILPLVMVAPLIAADPPLILTNNGKIYKIVNEMPPINILYEGDIIDWRTDNNTPNPPKDNPTAKKIEEWVREVDDPEVAKVLGIYFGWLRDNNLSPENIKPAMDLLAASSKWENARKNFNSIIPKNPNNRELFHLMDAFSIGFLEASQAAKINFNHLNKLIQLLL